MRFVWNGRPVIRAIILFGAFLYAARLCADVVPRPIAWPQLEGVLVDCGATQQELSYVSGIHDAYLQSYTALRHSTIAPLEAMIGEVIATDPGEPSAADACERAFKVRERALRDIGKLDRTLAEGVHALLGERAPIGVQRFALQVERRGFLGMTQLQGGFRDLPDVSRVLHKSGLSREEMHLLADALFSYDLRLTGLMRRQHGLSEQFFPDLVRAMHECGWSTALMADPATSAEASNARLRMWAELRLEADAITVEIAALNRQVARQVLNILPVPAAFRAFDDLAAAQFPILGSCMRSLHGWREAVDDLESRGNLLPEHARIAREALRLQGMLARRRVDSIAGAIDEMWSRASAHEVMRSEAADEYGWIAEATKSVAALGPV